MTSSPPDLGLLFDVDGPLASPVTRTVAIGSILDDLLALAGAGVPIAFITGRSDAFIRDKVITPLQGRGLAEALTAPGARMFGVYEKGAAWSRITPTGLGEVQVDRDLAPPQTLVDSIRDLVDRDFADLVFFDDTKRAMISVEQRVDVDNADYLARQDEFNDAAYDVAVSQGVGVRFGDRTAPDAAGETPFRIDPTIISTDIESVLLDKDHGARRALSHFGETGPLPRTWRTVGDSRSDYKMADELHAQGFDVAHVDVRPSDGMLDRPYAVLTEGDLIHDEAGAAFLRGWMQRLGVARDTA
ncbi:hypothetical protein M4I32_09910 [Microbacterium sp. LRZ72]|uniref:hypothetical protein n=1 Tax=Microbacterium sp. LRZ72 TaxID=2942481 RepID=UPI0029B7020C|nr:hypothetical protein [Microbacterium sp. LRZ72]MDX2377113.1 hypothetical protein [Microbacterium sp. LRZ72]